VQDVRLNNKILFFCKILNEVHFIIMNSSLVISHDYLYNTCTVFCITLQRKQLNSHYFSFSFRITCECFKELMFSCSSKSCGPILIFCNFLSHLLLSVESPRMISRHVPRHKKRGQFSFSETHLPVLIRK